ncbi:MAG: dephospho-CoA kinase [Gammaproteobacteria bacterium]|nr:dephospho-CoA kinase [Gammaproteobacteria bacterium]
MKAPFRIGLTGGIGSGKSTICKLFADFGIPVIDADQIAHDLVRPGQPALQAITETFGEEILTDNKGKLDRKRLRELVFQDSDSRKKLEAILHPLVYAEIDEQLTNITAPYCIICIPLLIETRATDRVDRVLVIDIQEAIQIQRACQRDNMDVEDIKIIMRAQVSRDLRLKAADDIIHNDGDIVSLQNQVNDLHKRYIRTSADIVASSI